MWSSKSTINRRGGASSSQFGAESRGHEEREEERQHLQQMSHAAKKKGRDGGMVVGVVRGQSSGVRGGDDGNRPAVKGYYGRTFLRRRGREGERQ